jgi:hypothetical protein
MTYACTDRMTESGPLGSRHLDGHFVCTAYQSKDLTTTDVPYRLRILKFGLLHPIGTS